MPDEASAAQEPAVLTARVKVRPGGTARRWQVLTLRGNRIADIRGFEDRTAAAVRAGGPA
jgi:hypothetical protein